MGVAEGAFVVLVTRTVAISDGAAEGALGEEVGPTEGVHVGTEEGSTEGCEEGSSEGSTEGCEEGSSEGSTEGFDDGAREGFRDGGWEGPKEGRKEGWPDGIAVGGDEGASEKVTVGAAEGDEVGTMQSSSSTASHCTVRWKVMQCSTSVVVCQPFGKLSPLTAYFFHGFFGMSANRNG